MKFCNKIGKFELFGAFCGEYLFIYNAKEDKPRHRVSLREISACTRIVRPVPAHTDFGQSVGHWNQSY